MTFVTFVWLWLIFLQCFDTGDWATGREGHPVCEMLRVSLLMVMIWLDLSVSYSSSCHHSPLCSNKIWNDDNSGTGLPGLSWKMAVKPVSSSSPHYSRLQSSMVEYSFVRSFVHSFIHSFIHSIHTTRSWNEHTHTDTKADNHTHI